MLRNLIMAALATALFAMGCATTDAGLMARPNELEFSSNEQECVVSFLGGSPDGFDVQYMASESADEWIYVMKVDDKHFKIGVKSNGSGFSRSAKIVFTSGVEGAETCYVIQK